jgi:hypothetical protein
MQIVEGDVVMSLNDKDVEVFYDVAEIKPDKSGATWIRLVGKTGKSETGIPLIFFDKSYMKVSKSTANILFGSKKNEKS